MRSIGEEAVDNKPADIVQRRVTLEGIDVLKTWVDKETGLPLKAVAYRDKTLGGLEEVEKHFITYAVVEHVDRGLLPSDLFSTPAAQQRSSQDNLTLAAAREFGEFDIYWVGSTFGAMPLASIHLSTSVNGDVSGQLSTLHVIYADVASKSVAPDSVQIHQRSTPSIPSIESGCGGDPGANLGEVVIVGGRQAEICDWEVQGVQLNITAEGTSISINGKDRQEVLQAAESLQKLN